MNRVVHFDLYAKDPERAMKFYQTVFGWEFEKFEDPNSPEEYWMIKTGPDDQMGINGGMIKRKSADPEPDSPIRGFICTIQVESIDQTMEKALANGAEEVFKKMAVESMGYIATIRDTEGNSVGLMEGHLENNMEDM